MRSMLWCTVLATALAAGGCKKHQDDTKEAASQVKKTAEDVRDESKDMAKTVNDKDSDQKDLSSAQGDLQAAKADLTAAKEKYSAAVKDRLAKLDIKMQELAQRTDDKAKAAEADLRQRRTELSAKLDTARDRAAGDWDAFTKDVDNSFDKLENDVNDALK